ncbi:MAG TPA: hypothetical protein VHD34_02310 [Xanthobacteraceae bacterium]|nr:hypothetical protein [Xanthobacteraceae bacterium]
MPDQGDRNFLRISTIVFIGALVLAAILFGTQIISTNEQGATVQPPQAPATRGKDKPNPSTQSQ